MNHIDKAQWQTTLAHYRAQNEAEYLENIRNRGKKTPEQKWQEFSAIMEFGLLLKPTASQHEQRQKTASQNRYYELLQRFENRR